MLLHGFGLFQAVEVGFGPTCWPQVLDSFRCCLTDQASSRWFYRVKDSCDCVWIVVAGSIWLSMVLYGVG